MRIMRVRTPDGEVVYGRAEGGLLLVHRGDPFGDFAPTGRSWPLAEVAVLAPVEPSKIVVVGRNYPRPGEPRADGEPLHPAEGRRPRVIGPGEPIVRPPEVPSLKLEAELAVVIGRRPGMSRPTTPRPRAGLHRGQRSRGRRHQETDGQWVRGKSYDTFCPLGPAVVTGIDPSDLLITCRVNGRECQRASTAEMFHSVARLVAFASRVMTLLPGDVIVTGTPPGAVEVVPGDRGRDRDRGDRQPRQPRRGRLSRASPGQRGRRGEERRARLPPWSAVPPRSGVRVSPAAVTRLYGRHDVGGGGRVAEVLEHQGRGPAHGDRVGDAPPGDVGGRAVHRLEHRRVVPGGVDVGAGRHPQAPGHCGAEVGEDVAEEVRSHDDIVGLGPQHQLGGEGIDVDPAGGDVGVLDGQLAEDLVPEGHGVDDPVRLGGRGELAAALRASSKANRMTGIRPRRVKTDSWTAISSSVP